MHVQSWLFANQNLLLFCHSCCSGRRISLKARDHGYAHRRRLSPQNKFVGSTLNSKIAITDTIIENNSFHTDIRRFG